MTIDISEEAASDLSEIWHYTLNNWSIDQADQYLRSIQSSFQQILDYPQLGKSIEDIRTGYRCFLHRSHIIFYQQQSDQSIIIIRILHKRMDYLQHL